MAVEAAGQSYRHPHPQAHSRPLWAIPLRHDDEAEDTDTITTCYLSYYPPHTHHTSPKTRACMAITAAQLHSLTAHRPGVGGWRNGEAMGSAMGRWAPLGQRVPQSCQACLAHPACCAMLHGRILAAFHKTSSALLVAPGHPPSPARATVQPCSHAATQPRQPILPFCHAPSEMAEWHGSSSSSINNNNNNNLQRGQVGRGRGPGTRWLAGCSPRNRHGPGRPAMAAWLPFGLAAGASKQ